MSYIRRGIGESDLNFDRQALRLAPGQAGVPLWEAYDPKRGGPGNPLRYLLSGASRQRNFGNFGALESNHEIRRNFHVQAENWHSVRNTMDPKALYHANKSLKEQIAPYIPWEGCSWVQGCPLNPYLGKYEITERIRETDLTARNRMSDVDRALENMAFLTPETREARTSGVEAAILKSEESRGKSAAQIAAESLPQALKDRTKELAQGNICTVEQLQSPIIGRLTCPGGVGCGWGCFYQKNKAAFILGAVVVLGVALAPYATLATESVRGLRGSRR